MSVLLWQERPSLRSLATADVGRWPTTAQTLLEQMLATHDERTARRANDPMGAGIFL